MKGFFAKKIWTGYLLALLAACDSNQVNPLVDASTLPEQDPSLRQTPTASLTKVPAKVAAVAYVSRMQTVSEPPGAHCPAGGKAIQLWTEKGADPDHFDEGIDSGFSVSYVCDGEKSEATVVVPAAGLDWQVEPAGVLCPAGGRKYRPFVDNGDGNGTAGDGVRNGTEAYVAATSWQVVCNGANGLNGSNGAKGLDGRSLAMDWAAESPGSNCAAGGKKYRPFVDDGLVGGVADDGVKNGGEVYAPVPWLYLCNGSQGAPGTNGTNGANGTNGVDGQSVGTDWGSEPAGSNCSQGGKKYRLFIDNGNAGGTVNDGVKNGSEIYVVGSSWQYVCHGMDGQSVALEKIAELSGDNCSSGGYKIRPFIDNGVGAGTPRDGLRNGGEDYVAGTSWQYVCNGLNGGMNGKSVGLDWAAEAPGAQCATGGQRFRAFIDDGFGDGTPADGVKNGGEAYVTPSDWQFVCNGAVGATGHGVGLVWNTEPLGIHCANGGMAYRPFVDDGFGGGVANDGIKNGAEEFVLGTSWQYVCNGLQGTGLVLGSLIPFSGDDTGNAPIGCANGGQKYQLYRDDNNNGVKDAGETSAIGAVQYLCVGASGSTGTTGATGATGSGLVTGLLTPFAGNDGGNAPTGCANGGQKYQLFRDDNNNGVKDAGETSAIGGMQYLCMGATGATGAQGAGVVMGALVAFSGNDSGNAPAGCANGGQKYQLYRDDNNNGTQDGGETTVIGGVQYLCVGATGATGAAGPGLVTGPLLPFSGNDNGNAPAGCVTGGQKYQLYRDDNSNGSKDTGETTAIGPVQYLCVGATGATGAQGAGVVMGSMATFAGNDGGNAPTGCTNGGHKYQFYSDDNNNGVKDVGESTTIGNVQYVCIGGTGPTGATGAQGAGLVMAPVTSFTGNDSGNAPTGCANGGQKYQFYKDDNNNGSKDAGETTSVGPVQYLCTGATGATGAQGSQGTGLVMGPLSPFTGNDGGNAPAGCAAGGQKFQLYRDDNNNGAKDGGETTAIGTVQYLCTGATGATGSQGVGIVMGPLSAFAGNDSGNAPTGCTNGGQKYQFYKDDNNNGAKDAGESTNIGGVQYVCLGATGATGATGQGMGIVASTENPGSNCNEGGRRIDLFVDNGAGGGIANNGIKDGTEAVLSTQYLCSQPARRNIILNGDMRIATQTSGGAISQAWSSPVDAFRLNWSGTGVWTAQQSTQVPTGFVNSLALSVTTADTVVDANDNYEINQVFSSDLLTYGVSADFVTVSFWVRASMTGTFPIALRNATTQRSYVSTYSITAANTWEKKVITIPQDPAGWSGNVYLSWDSGTGSTYLTATKNAWVAGNFVNTTGVVNLAAQAGATFYLTGVQLERGSSASPFVFRTLTEELELLGLQPYSEVVVRGPVTLSSASYTNVGTLILGQAPVLVDVAIPLSDSMNTTGGLWNTVRCTIVASFTWWAPADPLYNVFTLPCEMYNHAPITLSLYLGPGGGSRSVFIKPSIDLSVTSTGFARVRFLKFGNW